MGKMSKIYGAQVSVMTPPAVQRLNVNNMDRAKFAVALAAAPPAQKSHQFTYCNTGVTIGR